MRWKYHHFKNQDQYPWFYIWNKYSALLLRGKWAPHLEKRFPKMDLSCQTQIPLQCQQTILDQPPPELNQKYFCALKTFHGLFLKISCKMSIFTLVARIYPNWAKITWFSKTGQSMPIFLETYIYLLPNFLQTISPFPTKFPPQSTSKCACACRRWL